MNYPRELYDEIDLALLERWVRDGRQEDLHLDFKTLNAGFDKQERKNFARMVSGFANSDGGVVVWGVDCRKVDGIDQAQDLKPVAQVATVLGELQQHTGGATTPMVDGILHRAIATSNGEGFLITFIPASDRAPHMAGLGQDRYYYKRNGAAFYPLEHFDIADMFGKRQRPELSLALRAKVVKSHGDEHRYELFATLENRGRAMARFVKVVIAFPPAVLGWPGSTERADPPRNGRSETVRTALPLFPGETMTLACDSWPYHMNHELYDRFTEKEWPSVNWQIFQEFGPMLEGSVSFESLQNF